MYTMSCPRSGCQLFIAIVLAIVGPTCSVATDSEQSREILTLQQLPDNKDPAPPPGNLPDIQDLGLPASASSLPSAAAVRFPFLGASHGFLRSPPRTDEANLEEQAAVLQQELNTIRQQLRHESKDVSALSDARKAIHFHLAPTQMALREPGTYTENNTVSDGIADATAEAAAQATADAVEQASFYSKVGAIAALGLQLALIIAITSCICHTDMGIADVGAPIGLGMLFFIVSDVVWVYITLTGVLDQYIEQVLLSLLVVVLILGHIVVVFYIGHAWAHKYFSNHHSYLSAKRAAQSIVNVEHKIEAICSHLKVDVTSILHHDTGYDSEAEDGKNPASKSEEPPPDESAQKLPICVTFLNASTLPDADRREEYLGGISQSITGFLGTVQDDVSDPYCSCAVRGRKAACWFETPVIQNNLTPTWTNKNQCTIKDFRHGDTLKLKVWDSDMHQMSSELLGKVELKFKEVADAAKNGREQILELDVPERLEKAWLRDNPNEKVIKSKLTVRIQQADMASGDPLKPQTRSAFACC